MPNVYPLDPECPVVAEFMEALFGDPNMPMGAPVEDITEYNSVVAALALGLAVSTLATPSFRN